MSKGSVQLNAFRNLTVIWNLLLLKQTKLRLFLFEMFLLEHVKDENNLKNLSTKPLAFILIWKYLPNHSWSPLYVNESIYGKRIESNTRWLNAFQYYAVPVRCHQQKYTEKKKKISENVNKKTHLKNSWKCYIHLKIPAYGNKI